MNNPEWLDQGNQSRDTDTLVRATGVAVGRGTGVAVAPEPQAAANSIKTREPTINPAIFFIEPRSSLSKIPN
jgi:hypothetical protein